MAECPKCNHRLRLKDWKQICPYCGANIVLYDLQERLMQDADKAEVQYYYFQKKVDRVKAAYTGTKLAVVRLIVSLLPLGPLFLPLINTVMTAPLPDHNGAMSILDIYKIFGDADFGAVFSDISIKTAPIIISGILFLLSFLLIIVHFVLLSLACSPKGKVRNYTTDVLMLLSTLGAAAAFTLIPDGTYVSGKLSYGTYLYIITVVLNFAVDIAVFRQGIQVHHQQCFVGGIPIEEYFMMKENGISHEDLRAEMYKRLNAIQAEKDRKSAETEKEEKKKKDGEVIRNG